MYLANDIIKEGNPLLTKKCSKVNIPLTKQDKECIKQLALYLEISKDDNKAKECGIRPGVGIAAPQVGITKRMFAMNVTDFLDKDQKEYIFNVINPEIIARSEQMVYLPGGEGCLSVDRETEGLLTPRNYRIIAKCALYDKDQDKLKYVRLTLEGYPAIVFQHEYDHLDGIMYVDKMFKIDELDEKILPLYTINENEEDAEE